MKMFRLTIMISACLAMAAATMADITVGASKVGRVSGHFKGNGGEFTIGENSGLSNSAYANMARNRNAWSNSFQTFCLEYNEYNRIPSTVHIKISTTAINEATGVVGAENSGSHAVEGGKTYGDNLDDRTAFLYTEFATGNLSGYNYTPGSNRRNSAGALQQAIWYLEGERSWGQINSAARDYVELAVDATEYNPESGVNGIVLGTDTDGNSTWTNGIGQVRVLNIYGNQGYTKLGQDQLWLAPNPIPAPGAIILGGFGLSLIGWIRRRFA